MCYQTPRGKRQKLSKILQRTSKSTSNIGDSFKSISIRNRGRTYKPSNRYNSHTWINTFLENSIINSISERNAIPRNTDASALCASCARNLASDRYENEINKKESESDDKTDNKRNKRYDDRQCSFLKMITLCHDIKRTCIRRKITEVDAKILHLTGPSPRSCYVRQNVTGLITYKHYRERECRIKTISNETKHIALAKLDNTPVFYEKKKKCKDKHTELIFDIITKDMQQLQLHSMQLKESYHILSCLENYLGIKIN